MTSPDLDMICIALQGFRDARARVEAVPETTPQAMYVPLTEATWWAICVDDALAQTPGYRARRNASPKGQTVAGLNYARSALGHHWTFIAEDRELALPFTLPATIGLGPRWVDVEELPRFDLQKWARPHYDARVAGRLVPDTLEDADAWFTQATG